MDFISNRGTADPGQIFRHFMRINWHNSRHHRDCETAGVEPTHVQVYLPDFYSLIYYLGVRIRVIFDCPCTRKWEADIAHIDYFKMG